MAHSAFVYESGTLLCSKAVWLEHESGPQMSRGQNSCNGFILGLDGALIRGLLGSIKAALTMAQMQVCGQGSYKLPRLRVAEFGFLAQLLHYSYIRSPEPSEIWHLAAMLQFLATVLRQTAVGSPFIAGSVPAVGMPTWRRHTGRYMVSALLRFPFHILGGDVLILMVLWRVMCQLL